MLLGMMSGLEVCHWRVGIDMDYIKEVVVVLDGFG